MSAADLPLLISALVAAVFNPAALYLCVKRATHVFRVHPDLTTSLPLPEAGLKRDHIHETI